MSKQTRRQQQQQQAAQQQQQQQQQLRSRKQQQLLRGQWTRKPLITCQPQKSVQRVQAALQI
jgi:hypothetical protein